ncbi:MAG TPA: DUF3572 domain-containing protein [Xanthobacteraceae bacterium]|nr:DUF3572 domain-containing protein [Xanthobacteraceae bacterium]
MSRESAETLAVAALGFLAADPARMARFLALTGLEAHRLRGMVADPGFHCAVLEHLAGDERLLIAFAQEENVDPAHILRARAALGGPDWERETA